MKRYDIIEYCEETQETCVPIESNDGGWVDAEEAVKELEKLDNLLHSAHIELSEVKSERDALKAENQRLLEGLESKTRLLESYSQANEALQSELEDLRTQLHAEKMLVASYEKQKEYLTTMLDYYKTRTRLEESHFRNHAKVVQTTTTKDPATDPNVRLHQGKLLIASGVVEDLNYILGLEMEEDGCAFSKYQKRI